jgi:SLT domain-containing protein
MRDNIVNRIINMRDEFVNRVTELRDNITSRITELKDQAIARVLEMRDNIVNRIINMRDEFVNRVTELRDNVVGKVTELKDQAVARVLELRDRAVAMATELKDRVVGKYEELRAAAVDIFDRMVASVREKWDAIKGAAAVPINFVINKVWNEGIKKGWDIVAGALGIGKAPGMDPIPGYAQGGPLKGRYRGPIADNLLGIVDNEYPVKLNTDEWVHPVMSRRKYGDQFMHAVQTGTFPVELAKFAVGGQMSPSDKPFMDPAWIESLAWRDGRQLRGFAYGGVMNHVAWSGDEIQRIFGRMTIGGKAPRANASDHPLGLALDFMTTGSVGDRIADHLYNNAVQHALKYEIWKQRIRYPGGAWRGMADRGSITANHFDHVHASYMAKPGQVGTDSGGGGLLNAIADFIAGLRAQIVDVVEGPARAFVNQIASPPPQWMEIPRGVGNKILDQVLTWMRGKADAAAPAAIAATDPNAASAPGFTGPAAVAQWADEVNVVLGMLRRPASELGSVLRRIQFESGGNPRAINNTDINAINGVNSRGLMQVIPPTFAAYRSPALPNDIWDPVANIFAGSNYAIRRYGSLAAIDPLVRPRGYDKGGWIPPGLNSVYNATGRPEPVLTASEHDGLLRWRHMNAAQAARIRGGDNRLMGDVHIHAEERRAGEIMDELWHRMRVARRGGVYATAGVGSVG